MGETVIIGGGVAGLVAAAHLSERGKAVLLLEADEAHFGGRLKDGPVVTIRKGGKEWLFRGEHGLHGIWSSYLNLKKTLDRYEIKPEFIPAEDESWFLRWGEDVRKAKIGRMIRKSWIVAPFHYVRLFLDFRFWLMLTPLDWLSLIPISGTLYSAMAIDPLGEQKALEGMSLADFTRWWSPNLRALFAGLARNALAGHPKDVPAAGFIAFLRFYTLLRRDAWAFDYLPGTGGEIIVDPLVAKGRSLGATLRLGCRVNDLKKRDGGWVICYTEEGVAKSVTADHIILALDAPAAKRLLQESEGTAVLAEKLRFPEGIPTAIIRVWFDRAPVDRCEAGIFSGDFVMDNFFWLDQLQPTYRAWAEESGGSAIETHIYGPSELLAKPDFILRDRVIRDLYRAFPELRYREIHIEFIRNPATHTLFTVFLPDQHLPTKTKWPAIYACGDWVYHETPAMYLERATVTAIHAVNHLLEEMDEPAFEIEPYPEPEWFAGYLSRFLYQIRQWVKRRKGVGGS